MTLRVTFEYGTDIDKAQVLVQNRVAAAERRLPEEVRRNGVSVRKNSPDFLLSIHLFSRDRTYDQVYTSNYAIINVQEELARIEGVGAVNLFGAREYAMRVWLDPGRIAALGMTADEVIAALRGQNVQVAGGADRRAAAALDGRVPGAAAAQGPAARDGGVREHRRQGRHRRPHGPRQGHRPRRARCPQLLELRLPRSLSLHHHLADPGAGHRRACRRTRHQGQDRRAGARGSRPGLEYAIIYNPTEYIEVSARELNKTILEAIGLVVLVMLLFLQTWRATIVPMVAIPISLIGTFIAMVALGYSLNSLTMFALVLAVGIVVDDAIVVVENVERKLRDGLSPLEAARVSMHEVGTAVVAIAVVLVAVFIPAAFIGGVTGQFFRQFAVVITTATIISAFVSLTLSPALCALLFKPHAEAEAAHRRGNVLMRPVTLAVLRLQSSPRCALGVVRAARARDRDAQRADADDLRRPARHHCHDGSQHAGRVHSGPRSRHPDRLAATAARAPRSSAPTR